MTDLAPQPDDLKALRDMLDMLRRRLRYALGQQHILGVYTPFYVFHEIDSCRAEIRAYKARISALGQIAADAPEDTPTAAETARAVSAAALPVDPSEALRLAQSLLDALPIDHIPTPTTLPRGSRMPLTANPLFVGREDELRRLAATLKQGETTVVAAVTGMGGLGKTQLATEFVHRYGQFFAGGVCWMSFAEAAGVDSEIVACGVELGIAMDGDLPSRVAAVRRTWQEPIPRLLVFDNCEDEALLDRYRPSSGGCRVLVTSRRQQWDPALGVSIQPLQTLPRSQSIALLHAFRPDLPEGDPTLGAIASELGDLPLALHVAGSYLERYADAVTPAVYLEKLRAAPLRTLARRMAGHSPTRHDLDVARTVALSYQQLAPQDPIDSLALALLARSAYFAPGEPIPYQLLAATAPPPDNAGDDEAAEAIADALIRLRELGLLEREESGALRLHRLIAAFVLETAQDATAQAVVEGIMNNEAAKLNDAGLPAPLLVWQAHLRHITTIAMLRDDQRAAQLCNNLGYHLDMLGDYAGARPYYERALAIREKVFGSVHPDVAVSLNNLGNLLRDQGDYVGARLYLEQALSIRKQVFGSTHSDVAGSLNNLGMLLQEQGDYTRAQTYLEQALEIWNQVLRSKHPYTATVLNNLGLLLKEHGDLAGARTHFEQALAIREQVFGSVHPDVAASLNSLGSLLQAQGDYIGARMYLERALTTREQVQGLVHPEVAVILNNLGTLLQAQGDLVGAQSYLERALALIELVLGAVHPRTAISLNNLGMLLQAQGDLLGAREHLERALGIIESVLVSDHPYAQIVRRNLESLDDGLSG